MPEQRQRDGLCNERRAYEIVKDIVEPEDKDEDWKNRAFWNLGQYTYTELFRPELYGVSYGVNG